LILLDTQVLVWFAEGEPDLKRPARKLIEDETKTGLS
jgi:PIN domain nuclease of toxin-antitoxin system